MPPRTDIDLTQPEPPPPPFEGRRDLIQAFDDALSTLVQDRRAGHSDRHAVLMVHGVGGIGKTELLRKLRERLGETWAHHVSGRLDFTDPDIRARAPVALARARAGFHADGVRFPTFDLAFAHWWRLAYPHQPLAESSVPLLEEGGFLADVLAMGEKWPLIDVFAKVPGAVDMLARKGRGWVTRWYETRGKNELARLRGIDDLIQVEAYLRAFWAADLRDWQATQNRGAVLFLDTLEAFGRAEGSGLERAPDHWVRDWLAHLPGVLVVAAGRERLTWPDDEWADALRQHPIGNLSHPDADAVLQALGVDAPDLRSTIVQRSDGFPLYLDLAARIVHRVREAEDRAPKPDEFDAAFPDLLQRFLKYLGIPERAALAVLSVPTTFDDNQFTDLVRTFAPGYSATSEGLVHLRAYAFVDTVEPGRYALHDLVRDALSVADAQDPARADRRRRVHRHLLAQAQAILDAIDIRAVTEADERALREATGHQKALLPIGEWLTWYWTAEQPLRDAARWVALQPLRETMLREAEAALGADHPDTLLSGNNLGFLLRARGDLAGAEPLYRRALAGYESSLGADHPDTLLSVNNLGMLFYALGDLAGAEPLLRRALAGRESSLGADHPDTLLSVNNLGMLFYALGDLAGAEPLWRRALAGRESSLGADHPDTLLSVNNLGGLLQARGDLAGAEPLLRRALAGRESSLGADHPDTLGSVNNLGSLLRARGDLVGAEPLYRRALAGRESSLGADHPDTLLSVNNLGFLLQARGDLAGAEPLYRRALAGYEASLGPDHPDTFRSLNNLGGLLEAQGDLVGAETHYLRASESAARVLGPDHPHTRIFRANLEHVQAERTPPPDDPDA